MKIILPMKKIEVQYRNGMTIERLARMYYVSYKCMYRNLRNARLIRSYRQEKIKMGDVYKKYRYEKYTIQELANELHASCTSIIKALKECRLARNNGGNRSPYINEMTPLKVHFLHKELGMTAEKISEQCKISKRYIWYVLKLDTEDLKKEFEEKTK